MTADRRATTVTAVAPGRVNLIGDHTDYTGGLALPMAIDRFVTVSGEPGGDRIVLRSDDEAEPAVVALDVTDPATADPAWSRYVAGVVAEVAPPHGFVGRVTTTVPLGGGLSSSAALEVAVALALGADPDPPTLAATCQRAEQRASGVPCGIMDQLASAAGVAGHALLLDCHSLAITPIALPDDAEVVVVDSGQSRRLAGSGYAERRRQCEAVEALVGPLRLHDEVDLRAALDAVADPVLRRRARHVVSENGRVRSFASALGRHDLESAGRLMGASHLSLRHDFEVSTPRVDALVDRLAAVDGVYGVRMTGGGFGGCVVALTRPGTLEEGWVVRPASGAWRSNDGGR